MKLTKKANATIMKAVLKVNPKASKLTTLDQAWEILATAWDLEGEIIHSIKNGVHFYIYKNNEQIADIDCGHNAFNKIKSDFEWDLIYKMADEYIIKHKLYKGSKNKKIKIEVKEERVHEPEPQVIVNKKEDEFVSLEDLNKKKQNISVKICTWKKAGKDVTELQKKYEELKNKYNNLKNIMKGKK